MWLDVAELDCYGTQLLVSRTPFGAYVALCEWQDQATAATHLRTQCIGPLLWNQHHCALLPLVIDELAQRFALNLRPLNSQELPLYCETKWGVLALFPPNQEAEVEEYSLGVRMNRMTGHSVIWPHVIDF